MRTADSVPATTRSRSDCANCSKFGFKTYSPLIKPTRAPPIGPRNGVPAIDNAADVPSIAAISASMVLSEETTVAVTWISLK